MCPAALNSTISRNTALGHATQLNIQILKPIFINAYYELKTLGDKGDWNPSPEIFDFLRATVNPDISDIPSFLRAKNGDEVNSYKSLSAHELETLSSPDFLRTKCFPILATFEDDWLRSIIQRYREAPRSAIEVLERPKLYSIATWLSDSGPKILLIDVDDEPGDSSWTTDLLLELRGVFEAAGFGSKSSSSTIITHFFRKNAKRKSYGEETVLQDLLVQVVEASPEKFHNSSDCEQAGLTAAKLRSAANDPKELWNLIVKCIKQANICTLVIMLDHVEEMFLQNYNTTGSIGFGRFVHEFDHHIRTLQKDHSVTVKTMVTSRLGDAAHYFYEVDAIGVVIPNAPRRRFYTDD
ncbi:hypothetical protein HD806DRAFT_242318 [Xylariaceae sp. AK1471]|nr:hypothetical protein HD806DRAFT_242318 [Xylariaceae sp. AK1471]